MRATYSNADYSMFPLINYLTYVYDFNFERLPMIQNLFVRYVAIQILHADNLLAQVITGIFVFGKE